MITIETDKLPIHIWAEQEDLVGYDEAIAQATNLALHPVARMHIALMPDFHIGYGMPIGGVMACQDAVIPNAVGVDIGCGMMAMSTTLEAKGLKREWLETLRQKIHSVVPVGNGPQGEQSQPVHGLPEGAMDLEIVSGLTAKASLQMGTLGGGNHFIEIDKDEDGRVWLMLHSGSRAIGQRVCTHYEKVAQMENKKWYSPLPDPDLAFLPISSPEGQAYLAEMHWCMKFAEMNRHAMLGRVSESLAGLGVDFRHWDNSPIETHHNYANPEKHMGQNVWVHRKGAVKAEGPLIIPGSMGTASYICEGLNSRASFGSCSHGAGRVLGRKQANRTITHEQAMESMKDVVFGIRQGDYEEMPAAYKDIDHVIENQLDLLKPVHRLTPLAVVKG